jgi:hypothetical protein
MRDGRDMSGVIYKFFTGILYMRHTMCARFVIFIRVNLRRLIKIRNNF